MKRLVITFTVALLSCTTTSPVYSSSNPSLESQQKVLAKKYSNCSALNKDYPGGVAKSSKVKNKGGLTKHSPTVDGKVYEANKGKDRDKDGIACER